MFAQRCSSDLNRPQSAVFMKRSVRAAQTWHGVKSRGSEAKALSGWGLVDRWWWGSGGGWCRKEVSPASDQESFSCCSKAGVLEHWHSLAWVIYSMIRHVLQQLLFGLAGLNSGTWAWEKWSGFNYSIVTSMILCLPQRHREVTPMRCFNGSLASKLGWLIDRTGPKAGYSFEWSRCMDLQPRSTTTWLLAQLTKGSGRCVPWSMISCKARDVGFVLWRWVALQEGVFVDLVLAPLGGHVCFIVFSCWAASKTTCKRSLLIWQKFRFTSCVVLCVVAVTHADIACVGAFGFVDSVLLVWFCNIEKIQFSHSVFNDHWWPGIPWFYDGLPDMASATKY